ncbi:pilus assembly protein TadG-related protein [Cellulomonas sp. S1-8]|uniref:pilus assembly protein TadG-related protein n=1 Tax=Cellulomonas sp. S1-8 TaxID=2904790 RepID=UPI00224420C8|nr:pilus assembly protein TadG-related protein [Cellulomonas sp. S1-8]UZN04616.1 pilus assembly protein TadG-related protein [Cellulomonas sp. S1-8]
MTGRGPAGGVRRRWRDVRSGVRGGADDGQVMILSLGFGVLAILLVLVITAATAVHLDRKRLLAIADLAALAAADQVSTRYFGSADDRGPAGIPLTDETVRAAVEQYVRDHPEPSARWDGVQVLEATAPDGRSAFVRLGAVTRLPVLTSVLQPWSDGIELVVEGTARAS